MDQKVCEVISTSSGDNDLIINTLETYLEEIKDKFAFLELNEGNRRKEIWEALFKNIVDCPKPSNRVLSLRLLRTLSREKSDLENLITKEKLDIILRLAGLYEEMQENDHNDEQILEALKCLCNIAYQCKSAAALCSQSSYMKNIIDRIRHGDDTPNIRQLDMRLLFIITALCEKSRTYLRNDLGGLEILTEVLDKAISDSSKPGDFVLPELTLKVLFNITLNHERDESKYFKLVATLRTLLLLSSELECQNDAVNLLINVPSSCLKGLLNEKASDEQFQYEKKDVRAVYELLQFLKRKLDNDVPQKNQQELLSPILTVLTKCAHSERIIRKYLRQQILPPLKNVHSRPEEGSTLRNHLCRLLTTPITNVSNLAADLLFTLCKENVARMIKYTGYGNAAGLFAQRGLLAGRQPDNSQYSSDSEGSDTEEYLEHKHGINPVLGCYEAERPSPTANMTEEQKEYEAMQLVDLMAKLTSTGVVRPCRVGADGKPHPVEHVMELQEGLNNNDYEDN